jgi:hypothetical protein
VLVATVVASCDPTPSLAKFVCTEICLATFFFTAVSKTPDLIGLHDKAFRSRCGSIGDNDPPVSQQVINEGAERDGCFFANAFT